MASSDRWLASGWSFVLGHLPPAPCTVIDVGCGSSGGFVPALVDAGYRAIGVDPAAPSGDSYIQSKFEDIVVPERARAITASRSLHHVDDLSQITEALHAVIEPGGTLIVTEWAWERFDEPTARWCFDRLAPATGDDRTFLHRHRDNWMSSGTSWDRYLDDWTREHGLHRASEVVASLATLFETGLLAEAPHVFGHLQDTTETDERAAIDAGVIQPTGLHFVATRR